MWLTPHPRDLNQPEGERETADYTGSESNDYCSSYSDGSSRITLSTNIHARNN